MREQAPPRGGTPTVATTYKRAVCLRANPQTVGRLLEADGSLLFIVHLNQLINQIKHERHNAANGANVSNHRPKCRSYMYRLPGNRFPVKAAYTPPFRFHGMAGNRLLPHTVYKGEKRKADGGISQRLLYGQMWKAKQNRKLTLAGIFRRIYA